MQGFVPTNAVAGQEVQVFGQVTDNLGLSSGQQILSIPIADATLPALVVLSPTNNALFTAGDLLNLQFRCVQQFGAVAGKLLAAFEQA